MKRTLLCLVAVIVTFAISFLIISRQQQASEFSVEITADYTNTDLDEIVITAPAPGASISSPLVITGQARGSWYFEATAPVVLVDWDGLIIAEGYVTATDNWMTEEFVPFSGQIIFTTPPYGLNGAVILRASNPSGLSEYDRAVEIPIKFFPNTQ